MDYSPVPMEIEEPRWARNAAQAVGKTALRNGKQALFSRITALHVVSVACTAVAVGISIGNIYGWDYGTDPPGLSNDNRNKLMLLPAKILDSLIVASFSAIMLQFVINRLATEQGVPVGLLGGGYQVGHLKYLFHTGLWNSAFDTDAWVAWLLIGSILFGTTIGWSCNAVLSPRLAWWPDGGKIYNTTLSPYLNVDRSRLYPARLGTPNMTQLPGCDSAGYSFTCPGAAFGSLNDWTRSWANQGGMPNLAMTETTSQGRRSVTFNTFNATNKTIGNSGVVELGHSSNITTGTTLPQSIVELTALFWDYVSTSPSMTVNQISRPRLVTTGKTLSDPIAMPLVQVQCGTHDYAQARKQAGSQSEVVFPLDVLDDTFLAALNSTVHGNTTANTTTVRWPVDQSLWNYDRPLDTVNFTWVDISKQPSSGGTGASIGALFTLPKLNIDGSRAQQGSVLVPCLINAKWTAATLEYDPVAGPNVVGTPQPLENSSIAISPQWASLLDIASSKSNSTVKPSWNGTMMQSLVKPFISQDQGNSASLNLSGKSVSSLTDLGSNALPYILTAVLTEGLARQAYDWNWPMLVFGAGDDAFSYTSLAQHFAYNTGQSFNTNTTGQKVADAQRSALIPTTKFDFQVERFGYGFGPQRGNQSARQTAVIWMGEAVLLTYIVIVLGCLLWHCLASQSIHSWHKIEDMLALAMVSNHKPARQHLSGVGVKSQEARSKRVFLRDMGHQTLELFVGRDPNPNGLPKVGVVYH